MAQVTLYGMTNNGGTHDSGNIFKYNPTSAVFTDLVDFTGQLGLFNGCATTGNLILATDGNFYGMTFDGGTHDSGNIFKYNPTTGIYTDLVDFTGTSGSFNGWDKAWVTFLNIILS
jgi:uncharacterized repeat protein (TIGR03803 family)